MKLGKIKKMKVAGGGQGEISYFAARGLCILFFSYALPRGGNIAGFNPQVIWRLPPQSNKKEQDEGMSKSHAIIEFLDNSTSIYHSRAERSAYSATVLITNFVNGTVVTKAIFELITNVVMSTRFVSPDIIASAKFALNCQDPDIIADPRRLNARPTDILFDPFWAKMAKMVVGRVDDHRHGEFPLPL